MRACAVIDCTRSHSRHGYCEMHAKRWMRYGDPSILLRVRAVGTQEQRFWAHVNMRGPRSVYAPQLGFCWLWMGGLSRGYGNFEGHPAHRFSYESIHKIPDGLILDHLCRVRNCVRPSHLEPVTHRENLLRGIGFSAVNAAKVVCIHGHNEWVVQPDGKRRCNACNRINARAFRARHKAMKEVNYA